eukprot:scaffold1781_cov371-Pinguiococcus_pyrenoidosus.AAC.3
MAAVLMVHASRQVAFPRRRAWWWRNCLSSGMAAASSLASPASTSTRHLTRTMLRRPPSRNGFATTCVHTWPVRAFWAWRWELRWASCWRGSDKRGRALEQERVGRARVPRRRCV